MRQSREIRMVQIIGRKRHAETQKNNTCPQSNERDAQTQRKRGIRPKSQRNSEKETNGFNEKRPRMMKDTQESKSLVLQEAL